MTSKDQGAGRPPFLFGDEMTEPYDDVGRRRRNDFFDPTWPDQEAEEYAADVAAIEADRYQLRVYYDEYVQEFKCRCVTFQKFKKCGHLYRYKTRETIRFSSEWRDKF